VDAFCADPDLCDDDDLNEQQLCATAVEALAKLTDEQGKAVRASQALLRRSTGLETVWELLGRADGTRRAEFFVANRGGHELESPSVFKSTDVGNCRSLR
jgi:hypothetical protein